jgi:ribosome-associated toxin RatA of RatAB toxin-antitoxin module
VDLPVRTSATASALIATFATVVTSAGGGEWERVGDRDGIVVEQRALVDSAVHEVRAAGRSSAPPAVVLDTVWNHREYVEFVPYLKRLDILAEGSDWLLVYEQVAMPLVATDRDYTIRLRRTAISRTGGFEVSFAAAPAEGPSEDAAHVRVRTIEGSWVIEPHPDGGSRATYTVRSDPAGALPAWIVNRSQASVTARFVHAMLRRAESRQ